MNNKPEVDRHTKQPGGFLRAPAMAVIAALALGPICAHAQLTGDGAQFLLQSTFGILTEEGDHFGESLATGDFNQDGFEDLAIGIPLEDIGTTVNAGAVIVAFGSSLGLNQGPTLAVLLHQGLPNTNGAAEAGDAFGQALATGDFNHDGYSDLAVGVPGEDLFTGGLTVDGIGAVQVFPGGHGGIQPADDQIILGSEYAAASSGDHGYHFGFSFATGDTTLDLYDDLLVGFPGSWEDPSSQGGFAHIPGSITGLRPDLGLVVTSVNADPGDWYGQAMAIGDLDGTADPDFAISAPWGVFDASGPISEGWISLLLSDETQYFKGFMEYTNFGWALAVGDFRGAGYDQLLIGAPGWPTGGQAISGEVRIFDHQEIGLDWISQDTPGIFGAANPGDWFGEVIGVGDFNGDGFDDGVFGVPHETLNDGQPDEKDQAGAVNIVYGGPGGLSSIGNQLWTLQASALPDDNFGRAVAAGDFNGDGVQDLAIGVPGRTVDGKPGAGLVTVLYGRRQAMIFESGFEDGSTSDWDGTLP